MKNIEIEFKNLLTKKTYDKLLTTLPYEQHTVIQTNYYFDTKDQQLHKQKCALRIREKNNQYTATLKEPYEQGVLETNDIIDDAIKRSWLNNKPVSTPNIFKQLTLRNTTANQLHYFGSLQTKRTNFYVNERIEIALDHNFYQGYEDYEIEVEVVNFHEGKDFFETLLKDYQIKRIETPAKIQRFFSNI